MKVGSMRSDFCIMMADLARAEMAEIYATHRADDMPPYEKARLRELRKRVAAHIKNAEYWKGRENE
jgi:hypothetical protein